MLAGKREARRRAEARLVQPGIAHAVARPLAQDVLAEEIALAGCIQSQRCHTNLCPVGVATQDPRRARALDVPDKSRRVQRYQEATVAQAVQLMASMGCATPAELAPHQLMRRIGYTDTFSYAELFDWLEPGELLAGAPKGWAADWKAADPDRWLAGMRRLQAQVLGPSE